MLETKVSRFELVLDPAKQRVECSVARPDVVLHHAVLAEMEQGSHSSIGCGSSCWSQAGKALVKSVHVCWRWGATDERTTDRRADGPAAGVARSGVEHGDGGSWCGPPLKRMRKG